MRLFYRSTLPPAAVLENADTFFGKLALTRTAAESHTRTFTGTLGTLTIEVKTEGGHYTRIDAYTDQIGESRLDKNVKKYFVGLHRQAEPGHRVEAGY